MKPETIVGIVGMLGAMILYSLGVWGAFKKKVMTKNNVLWIIGGFCLDTLGTGGMYVAAGNRFVWESAHTWVALIAYFAMAFVAIVGWWAVAWKKEGPAAGLAKWALAPWALWTVSFLWGFLQRPSA